MSVTRAGSRALPRSPGRRSKLGRLIGPTSTGLAGLAFVAVLSLVVSGWPPLQRFDLSVVHASTALVDDRAWVVTVLRLVTNLGGTAAAWLLMLVTVVWLLIRRLNGLAAYVTVTGLGAGALIVGIKELVARTRPNVEMVVATATEASFPSGHALGSTVTYGVLLLVFLPTAPVTWRRRIAGTVVTLVVLIGLTRIGLGVHYPSDVVGGWSLGLAWLGITAAAFAPARAEAGGLTLIRRDGLAEERREPAPVHDTVLPNGAVSAARLFAAAVIVTAALGGVGLLITEVFGGLVEPVDVAIVDGFHTIRSDGLTTLAMAVGHLGGLAGIVIVLVVAVPVALAVTRRWTPAVFLLTVVAGQTAMSIVAASLVARPRPAIEQLSPTLPPTSSFPSLHVAAATATYVGIALLVRAWGAGWPRTAATVLAVVVPLGVALSRLYLGVHHPTDVLASVLYVSVWLAVCWLVLRPDRGADRPRPEGGGR